MERTTRTKNDGDGHRCIKHESAKTAFQTVDKNAKCSPATEFIGADRKVSIRGDSLGHVGRSNQQPAVRQFVRPDKGADGVALGITLPGAMREELLVVAA